MSSLRSRALLNNALLPTPGGWDTVAQLDEPYIILDSEAIRDESLTMNLRKNYRLINHPKHGFSCVSPKKIVQDDLQRGSKRKLDRMWRESEENYGQEEQKNNDNEENLEDVDHDLDENHVDDEPQEITNDTDLHIGDQPEEDDDNDDDIMNDFETPFEIPIDTNAPLPEQSSTTLLPTTMPLQQDATESPSQQLLSPNQSGNVAFTITKVKNDPSKDSRTKPKIEREKSASASSFIMYDDLPPSGAFNKPKKERKFSDKPGPSKKRKPNVQYEQWDYVSSSSQGLPALFICDAKRIADVDS